MHIHTRTPSHSAVEILEARVAPAGLVTVTFAGGVLTLDGDGADNFIDMSPVGSDGYSLSDGGATQFALNGAAAVSSVLIVGAIKSVNAKLGGGNDTANFNVSTAGSIAVDGGDGNDNVSLIQPDVSGPFTFKGGIGNDNVSFGGSYALIGGNVSIDLATAQMSPTWALSTSNSKAPSPYSAAPALTPSSSPGPASSLDPGLLQSLAATPIPSPSSRAQ